MPDIEVYSVDESFLDISSLNIEDLQEWGESLRRSVLKEVGIPVSVGIAPTKTLAKLASERAKKQPELQGVGVVLRRGQTLRSTKQCWGRRRLAMYGVLVLGPRPSLRAWA